MPKKGTERWPEEEWAIVGAAPISLPHTRGGHQHHAPTVAGTDPLREEWPPQLSCSTQVQV
jgi:hypothetical protein